MMILAAPYPLGTIQKGSSSNRYDKIKIKTILWKENYLHGPTFEQYSIF